MGSNQSSDPLEDLKKQIAKQGEIDRDISHRSAMDFYDSVGRGNNLPSGPQIRDVPKTVLPDPGPPEVVREPTKGGAGGYVVIGCIVASIVAHLNYGVNSGAAYAAVVGVTAAAIWIAYAMRQVFAFVIKIGIGIGVILILIRIFTHR